MKKTSVLIWGVLFVLMIGGCSKTQIKLEKLTESKDKKLAQTFIEKGQKYENEGDLVEALKQYELTLTVDPQNQLAMKKSRLIKKNIIILAQKHYRIGLKLRKKGRYLLAQKEFLTSLRLQPDHSEALKALKPKIRIDAKRHVIHTIKPGESLAVLAKTYYGDYKKFSIIADYNDITDVTRIRVGQKIKVPEIKGVPLLATTHEIQTETEDMKSPYSVQLDQEKDYKEEDVLEQEPFDELAGYRNLGIEHFDKKEYQEAIVEFDKVLNAYPDDKPTLKYLYNAHFQYAIALFEKKDYLAAKKNFEASYKYDKDCLKCRDYIKKSEKAYLEQELFNELAGYRNLGLEHFDKREYQEAIVEFDKVLNANPDDKPTLKYLYNAHFQYAIALFEKKDYLAAKKNFEQSFKYNKDCLKCRDYIKKSEKAYMETHYNRGLLNFGNQQLPEAIKEWELVQAVDPNYKNLKQNIQKAKMLLERLENIKKGVQ